MKGFFSIEITASDQGNQILYLCFICAVMKIYVKSICKHI